jgi:hypothetical protein
MSKTTFSTFLQKVVRLRDSVMNFTLLAGSLDEKKGRNINIICAVLVIVLP